MKTFLTLFIFLPSLVLASSFSEIKKALKQDGFGEIIPEELHPLISPNAKNPISVSGNSIIGDKSIKFEVNNGECGEESKSSDCDTDRERSEIYYSHEKWKKEKWYKFNIFLPKDYNSIAPAKMSLIQWKRHNPSKVLVMFQHTHAGLTFNRNKDSFEDSHIILKSNDVLLGQWTEIIFNTNWHPDEDKGFMKVWIDGILKIDFKGTSNTSKGEELNLRYGLYASAISRYKKAFNTEIIPQRIVYFDGVNAESKCEKLLDKPKCNNLTSQTIEKYELFMYDKNDIKFHNHSVVKLPINFLK